MKCIIEIATDNYSSTASAIKGGASRIELCSALSEGGLTPSYGYLLKCRKDFDIPLFPIIRPRSGDFLYSNQEFDIIKQDIIFCREASFNGIVTGFLLKDGSIDTDRLTEIVNLAEPMQVTFHRAFDRCKNPFKSLEKIITAGCTRILTSGQQPKATDGAALIRQLVTNAAGRIIIMPGSGVRKENIAALAEKTGAHEFHSSLRSTVTSSMTFIHPAFKSEENEYTHNFAEAEEVQALFAELQSVS